MITDEERREVARKLRELAGKNQGKLGSVINILEVTLLEQEITGTRNLPTIAHVLERYADLIDPQERTCRNIHDAESYGWFECSECGCGLEVLNDEGISNIEDRDGHFIDRPRYCPNCGAMIVEVDDEA